MKEQIFTSEVIRSIRHVGGWAYKIPDAPITKEIMKLTRFTHAKPCDIVGCIPDMYGDGLFVAIECKQFKKIEAFGIRHMQDSQIEQLPLIEKHGGHAYVFVNIRIAKPQMNRLIIFQWRDLEKRFKKGSIKAKELLTLPYLEAMKGTDKVMFDLRAREWRTKL